MAGTILGNIATGAADWTTWISAMEKTRKGFQAVSLTNFSGTAASLIGTGSVMELSGSFYTFTETAITLAAATPSAAQAVYYTVIPSAGGTTCTVVMEGTAPTFIDSKQGYYASAASLTRYIGGTYIGTAGTYFTKWLYSDQFGQDMPIGTIMMFDDIHWVDNFTRPGWYACIAGNSGQGCPNMVDKFVMGKVIAGAGSTGGSNTIVDHIHATGNQSASHTHTTNINHDHDLMISDGAGVQTLLLPVENQNIYYNATYVQGTGELNKTSGDQSASHTHTAGSGSVPGSTDSRPAWYSMIFIRKCA